MKVSNVDRSKSAKGTKQAKGTSSNSGSGFADKLRGASASSSAPLPAVGVTDNASIDGVDALLAMQEVGDVSDRDARKKAMSYGDDMLDRLKVIQDGLLAGGIPKEQLMEMAKKLRTGRSFLADKQLNSILDEIELRVEVEIAKHTQGL
ncbi:MAG: flagellar assembly protein FliX [Magnetovibrio sp.]|nr:flagellar assembly protein FliX [Magnetovibrio sp.]